jgi:hypothetical protein
VAEIVLVTRARRRDTRAKGKQDILSAIVITIFEDGDDRLLRVLSYCSMLQNAEIEQSIMGMLKRVCGA